MSPATRLNQPEGKKLPCEVMILGTRGIPARHGGFETFAEHLALYLRDSDTAVTVFCHEESGWRIRESDWNGIRLVHVPGLFKGALGTIVFDLRSTIRASLRRGLALTLGYNTALFTAAYKLLRVPSIINMDGLEWRRSKWSPAAKAWLYVNERIALRLADHLVADHPEIKNYLCAQGAAVEDVAMIPYGGDEPRSSDPTILTKFGLRPFEYSLLIARPEPENSIERIVSAYSASRRPYPLVVLGTYTHAQPFHARVLAAAGPQVKFPGAIYDQETVTALRKHTRLYLHGHTVGGTNPSLVEALAAGSPVLAHDNPFNRWVAGDAAEYFSPDTLETKLTDLLGDERRLALMRDGGKMRFDARFRWERILGEYSALFDAVIAKVSHANPSEQPSSRPERSS